MPGTFNGAVPAPSVEHGYHFHFGNVEKKINSTKAFDYGVLNDFLKEWDDMRKKHYNNEISDEEFRDWKISYPKKSALLKK